MEKIKKLLNAENGALIFGIAFIFIGIILLIFPKTTLTTICLVLGILIGIKGATKLIKYIKDKNNDKERLSDLIYSVFILLGAVVLILHPKKLLSIIPILIGIGILIYGIFSLAGKGGIISKFLSVISVIIGICIIGAPFKLAEAVTSITGASLIVVGVSAISKYNYIKDIRKAIEPKDDGYTEVEFTDVGD